MLTRAKEIHLLFLLLSFSSPQAAILILGADGKNRSLWGQECFASTTLRVQVFCAFPLSTDFPLKEVLLILVL